MACIKTLYALEGAGTDHTIVGSAIVTIGTSGRFASRRTASLTFVSYRLS